MIATGETPTVTLALGTHTITLTVTDPSGETDTDEVTVTVEDTTAPVLTVSAAPRVLTRPNHKYVTVTLADLGLTAAAACDGSVEAGQVYVASVSSDEPENADGDGDTLDDIVVDDCQTVRVRAERQGGGSGRVYTLTLAVADASGNVGTATYEAQVPLSRKGAAAVSDGAAYTVDGCAASAPASASVAPPASVVAETPAVFELDAPYPNPASGRATVAFTVEEACPVRLAVYDALGREVAVLADGAFAASRHEVVLDASGLPSGTYLVRLTTEGGLAATRRLTVLR